MRRRRKSSEELAKEFHRIEEMWEDCCNDLYLFVPESLEPLKETVIGIRGETRPSITPLLARQRNCRQEGRTSWAIDLWYNQISFLRENVDKFWPEYPEFDRDYLALENMYHEVYGLACHHLVNVAKEQGIDSMAISVAGDLCQLMVKTRHDREQLWGDDYSLDVWPDCHPNLLGLPPEICLSLLTASKLVGQLRVTEGPGETNDETSAPLDAVSISPQLYWKADLYTLFCDGKAIRKVSPRAEWTTILSAFQDDGWPERIDNPMPPKADLGQAIRSMNSNLQTIRFRRDGSGKGICWEMATK